MQLDRRSLFRAAAAAPLLGLAAGPARAQTAPLDDFPMAADPTVVAALRAASAAYKAQSGVTVHILPTAPALVVGQLTHQIQNDIVMVDGAVLAEIDRIGLFVEGTPRPRFQASYVLATANKDKALSGPIARADVTPGRPRDEAAILAALGLGGTPQLGAIDGLDAAGMALSGQASAALIRTTDLAATPGLVKLRDVAPDIAAPDVFTATVTRSPRRPKPEGFVAYLASASGIALMKTFGLEYLA